ncbi:hypothetical protein GIB67_038630 [Kingdonia uniflora]|uniref:Alpha/beta hydrolase fold-3 domain-containing protein n=1 Tax=Kingdonia uniflora TaxID=39325 RepID=A0A7J7NPU9_9MAGN|nr:hypothetical protein GIB67_038630 [Kingdonia uniflora]
MFAPVSLLRQCIVNLYSSSPYNDLQSEFVDTMQTHLAFDNLHGCYNIKFAYEDSWATIQWVLSDSWLQGYVDLEKIFLAGDSSGVNIVHSMAMRAGDVANPVNLLGVALIQPYLWGKERIGSEGVLDTDKLIVPNKMWTFAYPSTIGHDDPLVNLFDAEAPSLSDLGCTHVLVFITNQDVYRDRWWLYYETLRKSDRRGVVEIMETEGEDHVFHLFSPTSMKALDMIKRLGSFLNQYKCTGIM